MQKLPDRIDSKYRFVLLSAERAEQLLQGALPRVPGTKGKHTQVAMAEILDDVVDWDFGPAPEPEPEEAEGEEAEGAEEGEASEEEAESADA